MNLKDQNILFISANFFGYEKEISQRFQQLGAAVDFYNERPSDSLWSKGIIRVNKKLFKNKINYYYQKILAETKTKEYDYFLLIKGEAIPFVFLEKFREYHPNCQMIYYSYDTVQEYPKFLKLFPYFDRNFTFEPQDSLKYNLHFRPLFFLHIYKNSEAKKEVKYDLAFIGSAHTDRYLIGEEIRKICNRNNLNTFVYYFAPSKLTFLLKKIFDKNLKKFDLKKLSFRKLKHSEIAQIYTVSHAVLDINKPFQEGLTMRTFESLAAGRKLITTNDDIKNYPFYNQENILIIDRTNLELDPRFFKSDFEKIDNEHLKMMSLDSWIDCLLFKDQDDYWESNHATFKN